MIVAAPCGEPASDPARGVEGREGMKAASETLVSIPAEAVALEGVLCVPPGAGGVVLFAHGSGSGRRSPRNNFVAGTVRQVGLGTLLFDLLTEREDEVFENRFDVERLARRLAAATRWLREDARFGAVKLGYFGASTGAAAALVAAEALGSLIGAVVSRGGRPDLAWSSLPGVEAPTLLIVGALDEQVLRLNRMAYGRLTCEKDLSVVPGATHLFAEPGALEEVARLAARWFARHLGRGSRGRDRD